MQFTTFTTLLTLLFVAITASAAPVRMCGTQPYEIDKYTCYPQNNNLLCPILHGVIYQPCGVACFDPSNYSCVNGELRPVGVCNGQVFDKNSYVCVNYFLCPVGFPNVCGTACYNLSQYRCEDGKLVQQ
ncbi:hypothetical protein BZA05DRAFT_411621 [Tricharina praecox]|uniref:uncharacterized protein n=1 Tax=Tricharina praecox TaxID=43433 RepID=UPI00221FC79B|nr:uncharacterized protein BZA05DRAFT_411621 [Tricharina praecox]KAI5842842.1 hypothetical protein BZA05DRAFT_411621 [Tricharina praecox]